MSDHSTPGGTQTAIEEPIGPAPSKRASKRSAAAKLLQATALAAVLVPLGSISAEGSTCSFGGSGSNCQISSDGFTLFGFADPTYKVGLTCDRTVGLFDVSITDFALTQAQMLAKLLNFPGFAPVPIGSNSATPFIDFEVSAPQPCFLAAPT